ncbi:uncharacterized protein LOC128103989 [Peromyscus californicus insignis]|uniref:uncharacterized protein LOC128103989 n=1 Tax=Peromyscus californicus insignis TaxID=564181 RepID=UPI0022A6F754|nr:uncharacterized protein LOC128103989 [Peromyscus californicus insignis]XP_052584667.1 uncharacterized protein LOC128103989 [Peromyscus californicus insignis]
MEKPTRLQHTVPNLCRQMTLVILSGSQRESTRKPKKTKRQQQQHHHDAGEEIDGAAQMCVGVRSPTGMRQPTPPQIQSDSPCPNSQWGLRSPSPVQDGNCSRLHPVQVSEPLVHSSVLSTCKSYLLDKYVHLINVKRRRKKRWLMSPYPSNLPPHPLLVVCALSQEYVKRIHEKDSPHPHIGNEECSSKGTDINNQVGFKRHEIPQREGDVLHLSSHRADIMWGESGEPPTIKCYACPCFQFPPTHPLRLLKLVIAKVLFFCYHKRAAVLKENIGTQIRLCS